MGGNFTKHNSAFDCNFPGCGEDYCEIPNVRIAIVKNGKVLKFCPDHACQLLKAKINLRTLKEI